MLRLLTILALVITALMALAWPLSRIGVAGASEGEGVRRSAAIVDGALRVRTEDIPPPKPLDRQKYTVSMGGALAGAPAFPLPRIVRNTASTEIMVPLLGIMGVAATMAGLLVGWPWWQVRRRLRRGLCAGCGYPRPGADGICTECGKSPADAEAQARPPTGRLVRDAGVAFFAVMLALCLGAGQTVRWNELSPRLNAARAFDYSWYLKVCQPQLNGTVVVARPGTGPDSLDNLMRSVAEGTTIVLLPGHHDLFREMWGLGSGGGELKNVWLVGCGAETTSLSLRLSAVSAVRVEGVTIECQDNPFVFVPNGGSLQLRDCRVRGYNSGAGGSNAIFGVGMALLVEGCEFEGKSGRAGGTMRGNAFDLRVDNRVFLRGTRFVDNQAVFREAAGVLDGCTASTDQTQYFSPPKGVGLFQRGSTLPAERETLSAAMISETVDDLAVLRHLADGAGAAAWTDPIARQEVKLLGLIHDPAFWGRLLLHPSAEVRALAAVKSGAAAAPVSTMTLEGALAGLNKPVLAKGVVLAVLAGGDEAKAALEAKRTDGTEQERVNAAGLLRLMEAQPSLPELLRYEAWRAGR